MNLGEISKPLEGTNVRFTTTQSLGADLRQHGINGFFRHGRFWSMDMSDHWAPHEITNWERDTYGVPPNPPQVSSAHTPMEEP